MSQPTEIHTLAGAYALDALTEIERAGFARHVAECPSCAIEVAELKETASRLAAVAWQAPPPRLRESVLAEVARTRQLPPGHGRERTNQVDAARRWRRVATAAVAAGVIAIGGVAGVWTVQQGRINDLRAQSDQLLADQARLDEVLAAGDARVSTTEVPGGGRITVAVSPQRGNAVVLMSDLPAPPDGKAYQLWLMAGSSATAVATMPAGIGSGTAAVPQLGSADSIGVTIEPPGGSRVPSGPPISVVTIA